VTHDASVIRKRTNVNVALACVFSAGLGVVAFWPCLRNEFVYDDLPIILQSRTVMAPGPWWRFWRSPWWPLELSNDRLYRPLTAASFRLNIVLTDWIMGPPEAKPQIPPAPDTGTSTASANAGDILMPAFSPLGHANPVAFHVVNLLLHAMTCVGVSLLAYRLSGRAAAAWAGGAVFATSPVLAEAVCTGYGRAEVMAGLFGVWLVARHLKTGIALPRGWLTHAFNALLLLAAVMSKEHGVFVWPVLMLVDLWRRTQEPRPRKPLREWLNREVGPPHAAFALAAATFMLLRFALFTWKFRSLGINMPYWQAPVQHADAWVHFLTPFRLFALMLWLLVWPPRLCPIWSVPALSLPSRIEADVLLGMLTVALLLTTGVLLWRRRSAAGPVLIGFFALLAIPLQVIAVANWLFGERWLYLPLTVGIALLGAALGRLRLPGALVGITAAFVLLPSTWSYTRIFRDNSTIIQEVVRRQPNNFQGRRSLPGERLVNGDYVGAVQAGHWFLRDFGDDQDVYRYLALAYWKLGDARQTLWAIEGHDREMANRPGADLSSLRREAQAKLRATSAPAAATQPASQPANLK